MASTEQCNRCRFWREDMSVRDPCDENWGFGLCRRAPPRVIECLAAAQIERPKYGQLIDLELDITDLRVASRYPATFATDWCGKFEEKRHG